MGSLERRFNLENKRKKKRPLRSDCQKKDLIRSTPGHEQCAINTMVEFAVEKLPWCKSITLIGTPTAIAISNHPNYDNLFITDNYILAYELNKKTDKLKIVIGSGKSKKKAKAKADQFLTLEYTHKAQVYTGIVDGPGFYEFIENECNNNPIGNVAAFLTTSGNWSGKHKEGNMDLNFEKYAEKLSNKYSNLYILAMVKKIADSRLYAFTKEKPKRYLKKEKTTR